MQFILVVAAAVAAGGTLDRPVGERIPYRLENAGIVSVEDAAWLRLHFDRVELAAGSRVRLTSVLDGEVQELDAQTLARWGGGSAYFNGDTVLVDVVAGAGAAGDRVVVGSVSKPVGGGGDCGICGTDDRVPSAERWAARLLPAGCTASIYNEASCMVSAGHCVQPGSVVQFNVPDSGGDCSLNHPPVADQFPIVADDSANGGVGNDWAVLVPGGNSLGELPFERYGVLRPIAGGVATTGATAVIRGYGVDDTCTRSQVQQGDSGPIVGLDATTLFWAADIRGGSSGSAIVHDDAIVGVVTHCDPAGCPPGSNLGTRVDLPGFAAARASVCGATLNFSFPAGLPELVAPDSTTAVPVLVGPGTGVPVEGSGMLHVSIDGGPFSATAMTATAPNEYVAQLPAAGCGAVLEYCFTAMTVSGAPAAAPAGRSTAIAGEAVAVRFADDFEIDRGWTVTGAASDGQWQRGVPIPGTTCDRGNPGADGDGSGACCLTDNSSGNGCNSDVDGGATVLTSPVLDAGDPVTVLEYRRWFSTTAGSNAYQDVMVVELSLDGGASWTVLETVGPVDGEVDGGWFRRARRVPEPTGRLRVRFIAADADPPSVVEAGIDAVMLRSVTCPAACPWDLDGGGEVGIDDFLALLAQWGTDSAGPPDFDGDGSVGITDYLALLANWGACP